MEGDGEDNRGKLTGGKGNVGWSETESSEKSSLKEADDHGDYTTLEDRNVPTLTRSQSVLDLMASPWVVWIVFVISVVSGGSASPVILLMKRAGPISMAGWRHQVSALVMLPWFVYEFIQMPKLQRQKVWIPSNIALYIAAACALAGHFACYFWAIEHTSVTHCMFLTCTSPIFVAIYTKATGGTLLTGEIVGVSFGLIGVVILGSGTRVEKDNLTTNQGDFVALCAAVWMAVFLTVGKKLRSWVPLFVYQFPVAFVAAVILGVLGILLEGWNLSDTGNISGPFSWLRKEYFLGTIFLGVGPGVLGHAGYSFVIRYASPLVMPTGLALQPIIASVLCWAVGESPIPSLYTCVGGAVTLGGTLSVSCATANRMQYLGKKEEDQQAPGADEEAQQVREPLLPPSARS